MRRRASLLLALGAISSFSVLFPSFFRSAHASELDRKTDALSRQTVSTDANHTITFVTPTGVDASTDTITIGFSPLFQFGSFAVANFDLALDNDTACNGPWIERTLAAVPGAGVWGVARSGSVLTFTAPTDAGPGTIPLNRCVQIQIGANATHDGPGNIYLTNPSIQNAYRVDFGGTFGDSGFLWIPIIADDSVQISATVPDPIPPTPPDTIVIFRGAAYPRSQVTIERQGTILVTVPADPQARFDVTLTNQPAGVFTYAVYAEDQQGRVGRVSNFTLSITSGTTTTVSGVFLGPTIESNSTSVRLSETVSVLGATVPLSAVTIFVASEEEQAFSATADANGIWLRQFLGSDVGLGDHTIRAKAVSPGTEISAFSSTIPLSVTEGPPTGPCNGRNRADINCDGKVNLTDFSILLFFWRQRNPSNPRVDISQDARVDLTDLSILLFNWSR